MDIHPLKNLLQLQLNSDRNAVLHLPHVLSVLDVECFQPSPHLQKWIARVNSLVVSKDFGARWAGLSIALQTAKCSRDLMMECAQPWVTATLPNLSKNEPLPSLKAAVRLLRHVFTSAIDVPEFQRQVSTPNVPKFSVALASLAEKNEFHEMKILAMNTLAHLIFLYPTLHRTQHATLSSLCLIYLNGSSPQPTAIPLMEAASQLYSVLHHTGGKVGAATQWRKSMDDTIAFTWGALRGIRTTFPNPGGDVGSSVQPPDNDPVIGIPLGLDRLRAAVQVLSDLLATSNARPVVVPIGSLSRLTIALLQCTENEKIEGHVDPIIRSLEVSVVPHIQKLGCQLGCGLAECAGHHLTSHCSQLLFYVIHHIEQKYSSSRRLPFLRSATAILKHCVIPYDPLLPSRLARAVIPSLVELLDSQSDVQRELDKSATSATGKGRKGKKRARNYEGDEVFKVSRAIICPTKEGGDAIIAALNVIRILLRIRNLSPPVHSLSARMILWIYITLPQIPASLLSTDASLHGKVLSVVAAICSEIASGTTSVASKSLGLVVGTSLQNTASMDIMRDLELLLHPRVPPLVRSMPHVESLSLFRVEESQEEIETRRNLKLGMMDDVSQPQSTLLAQPAQLQPSMIVSSDTRPQIPLNPTSRQVTETPLVSPSRIVSSETVTRSILGSRIPEVPTHNTQLESPSVVTPPVLAPIKTHPSENGTTPMTNKQILPVPSSVAAPVPLSPIPSAQEIIDALPPPQEDEDEPMPSIDMDSDSD